MSFRPKYVIFMGICRVLKVVFWLEALLSPFSMKVRLKRSQEILKSEQDTTLVIVDMQQEFAASALVLHHVMSEIDLALQNDWAVIILEYYNHSRTYDCILARAKKSRRFSVETKFTDGGGREVFAACRKLNLPTQRFRVCGVNTHACVSQTVRNISRIFTHSMVLVVQKACAHNLRQNNWPKFFRFKSFRVVPV
mgnify:CR=1 FL=1